MTGQRKTVLGFQGWQPVGKYMGGKYGVRFVCRFLWCISGLVRICLQKRTILYLAFRQRRENGRENFSCIY